MSEMTSGAESQKQQQQYVGGSSNAEHHCKDCGLNFESEKSLEVHLHYHHENLLNRWGNKAPQEESNNNHSKTGNHNSHVNVNRENVTIPADSSEPSSMSPSQDLTSSQQQQQQQQQQQPQQQSQEQSASHTLVCQPYDQFQPMYGQNDYFMPQNNQTFMIAHHFSPSQEDGQSNDTRDSNYTRYHPYQHQIFSADRATSNSTSPQSPPFVCEKCGAVYDDGNQFADHMRRIHLDSPAYPSAPQYQQLGNSPQQQSQQQLHSSPPLSNQPQQQSSYDYNGVQMIKSEIKEQPEEQAEILDLDSHKVQTHRYEEEIMRHQQQGLHIQMHHQQMLQQQPPPRIGSVSTLNWPIISTTDYPSGLPPMGPNVSTIADQEQYMRGQHIAEHAHQGSSIITSAQPMSSHQMTTGYVQQPSKTPLANQSWKSNEPRRPKTYNCTACNKWFTSSGHLKRHYNTTLHKNAVKNGKEPDPATLPITAHHHPARENNAGPSGRGGGGAPARSPTDLSSSRSPPNSMAGPLGEATRGLLPTPTTLCNNSSNNDSLTMALVQRQQQQQQQQQQQLVHLSGIMPLNSPPVSSPLGHHQQQMGTAPHQLGLQQQQQPHLPTVSPGQPVHHSTTSPMAPPAAMNCHSPMGSSSHPVHHMNSPPGSVHPAMTSPTAMGGTTMPHQPYPNAMPPHVTIITSTPVAPLESTQVITTMQLVTTGNEQSEQQQTLPAFSTFEQKTQPSYSELGMNGFDEGHQIVIEPMDVGGLSAEEVTPQNSFESPTSNYDPFSPSRYKLSTTNESNVMQDPNIQITFCALELGQAIDVVNNNHLHQEQAKEDLDPNIIVQPKKTRKTKATKQRQITTTSANIISKDGFHKCLDCDKFFNKACYLTQHVKSFHSGDKPYKCSQCGKRFPDTEMHGRHVEMHAMARKHKCHVCPKVFAHKTDLKRHICIHTGKRPFKCDVCNKGFIRQDHMKKHQDTHNKKMRGNSQRQPAGSRINTTIQATTQQPTTTIEEEIDCLRRNFPLIKV